MAQLSRPSDSSLRAFWSQFQRPRNPAPMNSRRVGNDRLPRTNRRNVFSAKASSQAVPCLARGAPTDIGGPSTQDHRSEPPGRTGAVAVDRELLGGGQRNAHPGRTPAACESWLLSTVLAPLPRGGTGSPWGRRGRLRKRSPSAQGDLLAAPPRKQTKALPATFPQPLRTKTQSITSPIAARRSSTVINGQRSSSSCAPGIQSRLPSAPPTRATASRPPTACVRASRPAR